MFTANSFLWLFQCLPTYGGIKYIGKRLAGIFFVIFAAATTAQPVLAQKTILAFGDSLTQGYGLPMQEGFVPQLQNWLDAQSINATIINGGVSGDTTAGGAARIDWSLDPTIDAVILCLGGNDALRAISPMQTAQNMDAIVAAITQKDIPVLVIGMKAPNNYGDEYKTAFDAIFPDTAQKYQTRYAEDFFAPLRAISMNPADLRPYFQDDGLHPNKEGVAMIVDYIGPFARDLLNETR